MSGVSVVAGRLESRQKQHRRKSVLVALVAGVLASFLIACVLSRALAWGVQVTTDVLLLAYVAVLIHGRNTAAHREMDLRALGASARPH